jgi:hypothetical protein
VNVRKRLKQRLFKREKILLVLGVLLHQVLEICVHLEEEG